MCNSSVCSFSQSKESQLCKHRAPDKVRIFISKTSISWENPMFDHLLESSHRDDSNKWSDIEFSQEIKEEASIEIHCTHVIWCYVKLKQCTVHFI